jgi:N-acyl-D-aspartate/D-glutamate deacylase
METLLDEALAGGALGFSSSGSRTHVDGNGDPAPSRLAGDEELLALSAVTGRHEGTQLTLIPCSYNDFEERHTRLLTEMSRRANRPLNWNLLVVDEFTDERLAISDYAAAHGGRVLAITYPALIPVHYTFFSSVFDGVPYWPEVMTLPPEEKLRAIKDPEVRQRLRAGLTTPEGRQRPVSRLERHMVEKGHSPETKPLEGRLLGDIAAERAVDPLDLLLDLMIADNLRTGMRRPPIGEDPGLAEKRQSLWTDPRIIVGGSDAGAHLDFLPAYNYTAKYLELTRQEGIPVETAVNRITDMPARLYGLRHRGRVSQGWWADLCIFDAQRITDGTMDWKYDLPGDSGRLYSQPDGIKYVLVNGTPVIQDGQLQEERAGQVLRSGVDTETVQP